MSMFDEGNNSGPDDLKNKILSDFMDYLLDRGGSELASKLAPPMDPAQDKGLAVEVQAPDKEHLQDGLEKAGDVLDKVPDMQSAASPDDGKSDDEKLADLLASEDEDDEDKR